MSLTREQLEGVIAKTVAYWHSMTVEEAVGKLEPVIGILLQKDHDYGPGNLYKTGEVGILVRIADKATRIANLEGKAALVADEATADTAYDLIGYALRYVILQEERIQRDSSTD